MVCPWCAVAGGGGKGAVLDTAGTEAVLGAGTHRQPFCQWGSRWKCWGGAKQVLAASGKVRYCSLSMNVLKCCFQLCA